MTEKEWNEIDPMRIRPGYYMMIVRLIVTPDTMDGYDVFSYGQIIRKGEGVIKYSVGDLVLFDPDNYRAVCKNHFLIHQENIEATVDSIVEVVND